MQHGIIFAIGNILREDDGLGAHILNNIRQKRGDFVNPVCIEVPQLDIIHTEMVSRADYVICIDARIDEDDTLVTLIETLPDDNASMSVPTSHHLSFKQLLSYSKWWYDKAPKGYLVLAKGYRFEFSDKISGQALLAAEAAEAEIMKIIHLYD